jgi:SAM-dependent methyltransferase
MSYSVAKIFWRDLKHYPSYPNVKERRLIDVNFIVSNSSGSTSVIDLGCGDGYLLIALREFTGITEFYGYDISEKLLQQLTYRWGKTKGLNVDICDFVDVVEFPKTDLTVSMGMFPYIFNINDLESIINAVTSDTFIVRVPCTGQEEDEYIDTYSKDLDAHYSSIYRTKENYLNTLKKFYREVSVERSYSDDIESKYGTKHYYFTCKRRSYE